MDIPVLRGLKGRRQVQLERQIMIKCKMTLWKPFQGYVFARQNLLLIFPTSE